MATEPNNKQATVHGVLHLIGRDRVGILQDASAFVSQRGATIEEGISHTLKTEAIVLLRMTGTPAQMELVQRDTPKLGETLKLLALYSKISDIDSTRDALPLTLRVTSPDFSGLLTKMTQFFTRHDLRIVEHHTNKSLLPHSQGSITYRHKFTVLLPSEFNRKQFIAELDELVEKSGFIRDDITHSDFY